jgi:hypothetical protein
VFGRESLQRGQRRPVVAELRVVVVLDHEASLARPDGKRGAALRRERDARRRLVRRRRQHGVGAGRPQRLDVQAVVVDADRHDVGPDVGQQDAVARHPGILDRDPWGAPEHVPERDRQQPERLLGPGRDHDALGVGHHAAHAPQIRGELRAQPGLAPRVGVAERMVGHPAQGLARAAQPLRTREDGEVGGPREEVVAQARRARRTRCRLGRCLRRIGAYVGPGARTTLEVALGAQLLVGVDDEPPRDAEVAGQHARGRQASAGRETPGADGVAQPGLELAAQRLTSVASQLDQDLRTNGPLLAHEIGPYYGTTRCVAWQP